MTRSVNVQEALSKEFKCPLNKSVNPDEAVALGAATQANVLVGGEGAKDILLLDVTPLSVGIETEGKLMTVMVEANTTIPTSKSQVFTTAADNQPSVFIKVLQGERQFSADNKVIGTFELGGIMPARRGVPQIEVTFSLDANGILTVSAKDKGTGKENSITIKDSNSMSQEEIERIKADAERFKEEDAKKKAEVDKLNACESFAYQVRNSVEDDAVKELVTEDEKKVINEKVEAITEAVKAQNGDKAEELRKELENYFNPIAQRIYQQQASAQAEQPNSQPEQPQDNAQPEAEDVTFEEVK
jgi:molecular chaperone DnaK